MIRVILAEDNTLLRQGVSRLLEQADGVTVVAECDDLLSLTAAVDAGPPDVVVTDIRMPPSHTDEGIQAAAWLAEHHPDVGVVVVSQHVTPEYAVALLESGSGGRAYLLKEHITDARELLDAVNQVHAGGSVIDPTVVEALVAANRTQPTSPVERLTPRELDVLHEMAQGKTNAAIAESIVLSLRAIEKHSNAIFSKLGLSEETDLNRRVKAVLMYLAEQD